MPGKVVTPDEWRAARLDLLEQEKEHTKNSDRLAKLRADMPLVKVTAAYKFTGPNGDQTLKDLFHGRKQLILYHFMFDPSWSSPCKSCSFAMDEMPKHLEHLHSRNTTLVIVSRAPYEKIASFHERMGWSMPWYSSNGSDFNYDFSVTLDESVKPAEYNYRSKQEHEARGSSHFVKGEQPGWSVFFAEGDEVYHSYSCYARGPDHLWTTLGLLDLTPLGRQDGPQNGEGLGFKYHDEY